MASRSLHNLGRLLLCVIAVVAAGSLFAQPEHTKLKQEITRLEKSVSEAREARNEADRKLEQNRRDQGKAEGANLRALKQEARALAKTAGDKADALTKAQRDLADKQGELRKSAAAHAVKQLTERKSWMERAQAAEEALRDWEGAIGALPEAPKLRSLEGIVDPKERAGIREQDKKALKAVEDWCDAEVKRVDKEIKQADDLAKPEADWKKVEDKHGEVVLSKAKSLKKSLEARKKKVEALQRTAKDRRTEIK